MTKKMTAEATASAPTRSPARVVLAARIASRERAHELIGQKQDAARRLALIGEAAQALASQLAGVKASAAATLAAHVLGGSGSVPKLADDGRAELAAKLAEAEARAEAAGPAMVQVQAEITSALRAHGAASAAVPPVTRPVVEEEIAQLIEETRAVVEKLVPLTRRLAGAGHWAVSQAHTGPEEERAAFFALAERIGGAMRQLRIDPNTPSEGADAAWEALRHRLAIDADAVA